MSNLYRYFHRVEEADSTSSSELETGYESDETVLGDNNQRPASPPTPAPLPMRYWEDNAEDDENAWDEAFDRQLYLEMIGDEVPFERLLDNEEQEIEEVAAPADPPDQEIQLLQVVADGISDLVGFYQEQQRLRRQAAQHQEEEEEPAEEVVILGRSVATQTTHQLCECPFCPNL